MEARRHRMVMDTLRARDITNARVLAAFSKVPREEFVPARHAANAYADMALPIGLEQTISQPYVVAMTVQALALSGHERVLEVGAGSGYAAAILGQLAREVHSIERIPALALNAAEVLAKLGYDHVHVHHADGTLGWPAAAPYAAIAVAAGAPRPPQALLDQLAVGGRLVIPTGDANDQLLLRITRLTEDAFEQENLGAVRFVPLLGEQGWPVSS